MENPVSSIHERGHYLTNSFDSNQSDCGLNAYRARNVISRKIRNRKTGSSVSHIAKGRASSERKESITKTQ